MTDYLNSLYDIVNNYASKNFINSNYLKINNKFYKIKLYISISSFVTFELIENKDIKEYTYYSLMIEDKNVPNYEHKLKENIDIKISELIQEFMCKGADENLIKELIRESIE